MVAPELDPSHIHPPAGIDEECEIHLPLLLTDLGDRIHVGERVALVTEAGLDVRSGCSDVAAVEDIPLADLHQGEELLGRDHEVAGELDGTDLEGPALGHVDRDVDEALVGGDGHLGGIDREVDEAPVQVVGPQTLQVPCHLLLRVAIRAREPGEHRPGRRFEEVEKILLLERLVADEVDTPDARHLALVDIEVDAHPMALERRHRRLDLGRIAALSEVGLAELLHRPVHDRGVVRAADREPRPGERLEQILGLELLVAGEVDGRDGRTLHHHHHQGAAVALDPHIVEEAGCEQALDGLRGILRADRVADGDRDLVVHRTGGDATQAFYPEVLDDERLGERRARYDRQQPRPDQPVK